MRIEVDKIAVDIDVIVPDAVVVEASAVAPSGIVTEAVAKLPTQVIVISHEETPTVTPLQIIDYSSTSIECAFDVTTQEADEVVRGVLCGTENPPTFENADYRLLHGQGSIDLAFAGLHNNTEYYLRPYALSNLGYKYGDVVVQRTKYNPIPDEYQLVEYLRSTGTQYINLNVSASTPNIGIQGDFSVEELTTATSIFGAYGGGWCFFAVENNSWSFIYNSSSNQKVQFGSYDNIRHRFSFNYLDNHIVLVDDDSHSIVVSPINSNIPIFGYFVNGRISYYSKITIYDKLLVSKGNEMLLTLYPVYRKADNKSGMYDIVNNQFYVNQGSGEFRVGPDKEWEE